MAEKRTYKGIPSPVELMIKAYGLPSTPEGGRASKRAEINIYFRLVEGWLRLC